MRILFVLVGVSMLSACGFNHVPHGCRAHDNCDANGVFNPSFYPTTFDHVLYQAQGKVGCYPLTECPQNHGYAHYEKKQNQ